MSILGEVKMKKFYILMLLLILSLSVVSCISTTKIQPNNKILNGKKVAFVMGVSDYNGTQYEQVSEDFMNAIARQDNDGDKFIAPVRYWDNGANTMQDVGMFESSTWNGNYVLPDNSSVTLPANARVNMEYEIGQVSYQFMFE
jgi:hypothetical protein